MSKGKMYVGSQSTVNVITYVNEAVQGVTAFKDHPRGNCKAEALFVAMIKENYAETSAEDIEASLDNGYFEQDGWQIFLTHST